MEKAPSVFLTSAVTLKDLNAIVVWLGNRKVVRYLNECDDISDTLQSYNSPSYEPMLGYYLSREGVFLMIKDENSAPIGFIKLKNTASTAYEMVIVIGDSSMWGQGYGKRALKRCLSMVFLEQRKEKIVAKIYKGNHRSYALFKAMSFRERSVSGNLICLELTFNDYLTYLSKLNTVAVRA